MIFLKLIGFSLKINVWITNIMIWATPLLTFIFYGKIKSYSIIQEYPYLIALPIPLLFSFKYLFQWLNKQIIEIKNLKTKEQQLTEEKKSLEHYRTHLREAEIFLAKQVEKHNHAKENLKKEVREYHQELLNDFILKHSKNGTEQ